MLSGLVFFGWGEIFSLFPPTPTDTFGSRLASTHYGFLYTGRRHRRHPRRTTRGAVVPVRGEVGHGVCADDRRQFSDAVFGDCGAQADATAAYAEGFVVSDSVRAKALFLPLRRAKQLDSMGGSRRVLFESHGRPRSVWPARWSCAVAPSRQAAQGYPVNTGRDSRGGLLSVTFSSGITCPAH